MHKGHEERGSISAGAERTGRAVLDAAFAVHRELGPGMLENVYEQCLAEELRENGLQVEQQLPIPVVYRSIKLEIGYRLDLLVNGAVIVEVKPWTPWLRFTRLSCSPISASLGDGWVT